MTSRLQWWEYILLVLSIFLLFLLLNFVVKKINEVRIKEKMLRLQGKTSRSCCTQVQEEPVPTESTDESGLRIAPNATLVNKEDNLNSAHGKSNANLAKESNLASQSKIDAANSKLNFLGAIYTDSLPSKEAKEKPEPMQICDNDNGSIFKEVMERKVARYQEN